jgi:hypothetical protein
MGLGVGGGVTTALFYEAAANSKDAYAKKRDAARANPDLRQSADDYYDNVVLTRYTRFYAAGAGTGVLLLGGALLVILDVDGPMLTPMPGGGMLTWSGHF